MIVQGDPDEHELAEDDELLHHLLADGYAVRLARGAAHARSLARASTPELVLIQTRHHLREALDLVREIRGGDGSEQGEGVDPYLWPARIPVIVTAPRRDQVDVLRAFDAGADDYLAVPVFYLELHARMRALLDRCRRAPPTSIVRAGTLTIDVAARSVTLDGHRLLLLPRMQYELLLALAREPRRVIGRAELMRRLWGAAPPSSTRALDSHASRLRRALQGERSGCWIVSVRGVGYRLR